MFSVGLGEYELRCQAEGLPDMLAQYLEHAALAEQIELSSRDGAACFFALSRRGAPWPFLVVAQRYEPAGCGFIPGALVVSESQRLFLGAGRRLLCYSLSEPARFWEDVADCGFWFWSRWGRLDGGRVGTGRLAYRRSQALVAFRRPAVGIPRRRRFGYAHRLPLYAAIQPVDRGICLTLRGT